MNDLIPTARRINEREQVIQQCIDRTVKSAGETLAEMLLQGQELATSKQALPHGQWLPWLKCHCPNVDVRRAQRYMRLASDPDRVSSLIGAGSLRQALAMMEDGEDAKTDEEIRRWPPYMETINRFSRLARYVETHPIRDWPTEGKERFREQLKPLVAQLWPGVQV